MRNFNQYKPQLAELYSVKYSFLSSIKTSPKTWATVGIIFLIFLAISLMLPIYKLNQATAHIQNNNAKIALMKTAIEEKVNRIEEYLVEFKIEQNKIASSLNPVKESLLNFEDFDIQNITSTHSKLIQDYNQLSKKERNLEPIKDLFIIMQKSMVISDNQYEFLKYHFKDIMHNLDNALNFYAENKQKLNQTDDANKKDIYNYIAKNYIDFSKPKNITPFKFKYSINSSELISLFYNLNDKTMQNKNEAEYLEAF